MRWSSFNGAAARELRMPSGAGGPGQDGAASMGPQLVSCGCDPECGKSADTNCFNGAAARELRMPDRGNDRPGRDRASMGPQLVSCGCRGCSWWSLMRARFNGAAARELRMHLPGINTGLMLELQWGRSS